MIMKEQSRRNKESSNPSLLGSVLEKGGFGELVLQELLHQMQPRGSGTTELPRIPPNRILKTHP